MLFGEIIRVALQSIRANMFRAVLTMLGIIIGVGAVITMLAAGAGAQRNIDEQIAALGSNILTVNASQFFSRGISRNQLTLKIDDIDALQTESKYLDAVVPEAQNRGQIKYENMRAERNLRTTWRGRMVFSKASHKMNTSRTRPKKMATGCMAKRAG